VSSSRKRLTSKGRWVVKIGSALLTDDGKGLDQAAIAGWVEQIAVLVKQGVEVVLVSSGAVAEGMSRLGWSERPSEMFKLQAAAAVGQMGLVQAYESSFQHHHIHTAQVLLTHDDLSNRKRYLNARSTLRSLIDLGVVAIVNENDTVVTSEIQFGDNDTLGALVANAIEADALILLTDQKGLYSADPRSNPDAVLISEGRAEDDQFIAIAGSGGRLGRGGMATKVRAARLASRSGAVTVIASGREENALLRMFAGEEVGTLLVPEHERQAARKHWIAGHLQSRGRLYLDEGAVKALKVSGRSLLAAGVVKVEGDFSRGEMVEIVDQFQQVVARGLVNYSVDEALKIMGHASHEFESLIGHITDPELVHRDNMALS
jgi:glutamate 5-kinase